jgi:chromosome segregation ATPase
MEATPLPDPQQIHPAEEGTVDDGDAGSNDDKNELRKKLKDAHKEIEKFKLADQQMRLLLVNVSMDDITARDALPRVEEKITSLMRKNSEQSDLLATLTKNNEKMSEKLASSGVVPSRHDETRTRLKDLEIETKLLEDDKVKLAQHAADTDTKLKQLQTRFTEETQRLAQCEKELHVSAEQLSTASADASQAEAQLLEKTHILTNATLHMETLSVQLEAERAKTRTLNATNEQLSASILQLDQKLSNASEVNMDTNSTVQEEETVSMLL